jgi:hypothetical protein
MVLSCLNQHMPHKKSTFNAFSIIKSSFTLIATNSCLWTPIAVMVLLQWIIIDLLFFYPQAPLNEIFAPIITNFYSPNHMHYPFNLYAIPNLMVRFDYPLTLFVKSFLISMVIVSLWRSNEDDTDHPKGVGAIVLKRFIHIIFATLILLILEWAIYKLYDRIAERAMMIRSQSGWTYWLKMTVLEGQRFFKLLGETFLTFMFIYVYPVILIDRRNVFVALFVQFKYLFRSFWSTLLLVLVPTFLLVLLLVLNRVLNGADVPPEANVYLLVLAVLIYGIRDLFMYVGITTRFLLDKENA